MKSLYFCLTSLVLGSGAYATEFQDHLLCQQPSAPLHSQISTYDLKQDDLNKHSHEAVNTEFDKMSLQQEVERYTSIVGRLELANGKIPETTIKHFRQYKEALEQLKKEVEKNSQISIKKRLFIITQNHNRFSGGYY